MRLCIIVDINLKCILVCLPYIQYYDSLFICIAINNVHQKTFPFHILKLANIPGDVFNV